MLSECCRCGGGCCAVGVQDRSDVLGIVECCGVVVIIARL